MYYISEGFELQIPTWLEELVSQGKDLDGNKGLMYQRWDSLGNKYHWDSEPLGTLTPGHLLPLELLSLGINYTLNSYSYLRKL